MTKLSIFGALVALFTVVGCAADPESDADVDGVIVADEERVEQSSEALSIKKPDPTPFCLPGEVVKCTLGPPPVCRCVPVDPPILQWSVAR